MTSEFAKYCRLACELGGAPVHEPIAALERLFDEMSADYESVQRLAAKRSGEITHLKAQIKSLKAEATKQAERITELLHDKFSPKSETAEAKSRRESSKGGDGNKPDNTETSTDSTKFAAEKPKRPRNKSGRRPKNWDNLERIEIPMDFPDTCPCGCGGTIRTYDIDEKRELIPAKFYIAVRQYPRYWCRNDDVTIGTLYKPTLMPGVTSGTSMLAYLVTMRYGWGYALVSN